MTMSTHLMSDRTEAQTSMPKFLQSLPKQLQNDIIEVIRDCPKSTQVFESLIQHFETTILVPDSKRRKLTTNDDRDQPKATTSSESEDSSKNASPPVLVLHDLSLTAPVRKRLQLQFTLTSLQLVHPVTGAIELSCPLSLLRYVACLPTPNRAKPHWTFCFIFTNQTNTDRFELNQETTILFGMDDQSSLKYTVPEKHNEPIVLEKGQSIKSLIIDLVQSALKKTGSEYEFIEPHQNVFVSAQSQKKRQSIYHVDTYLKAKEGQLYFMKSGIFFGFKKPVLFFPTDSITSMNITGVTGRTFNLVISTATDEHGNGSGANSSIFEFSMLDNSEYDAVSVYIQNLIKSNKRKQSGDQKSRADGGPDTTAGEEQEEDVDHDDEEEEEDEDFEIDEDDGSVDEEYDSDHQTDSEASSSEDEEEEGDETEPEEEEDEEEDHIANPQDDLDQKEETDINDDDNSEEPAQEGSSSHLTGLQSQLALIEQQRSQRFHSFVKKHGAEVLSISPGPTAGDVDDDEIDIDYDAMDHVNELQDEDEEEDEEDELM